MPLTVRKFNAQVKDPQSGQMVPAGLLSSDSLQAIEAAESAAITEIQQKGAQTKADIPDDYTELSDSVDELKTQLHNIANYKDSTIPAAEGFVWVNFHVDAGVSYRLTASNNRRATSVKTKDNILTNNDIESFGGITAGEPKIITPTIQSDWICAYFASGTAGVLRIDEVGTRLEKDEQQIDTIGNKTDFFVLTNQCTKRIYSTGASVTGTGNVQMGASYEESVANMQSIDNGDEVYAFIQCPNFNIINGDTVTCVFRQLNAAETGSVQTAKFEHLFDDYYYAHLTYNSSYGRMNILYKVGSNTLVLSLVTFGIDGIYYANLDKEVVYVSPTGSDTNTGTADSPYRTFTKALKDSPKTIVAKEGIYNENIEAVGMDELNILLNKTEQTTIDSFIKFRRAVELTTTTDSGTGLLKALYTYNTGDILDQVFISKTQDPTYIHAGGSLAYAVGLFENGGTPESTIGLVPVLTITECQNTEGSFTYDGIAFYINPKFSSNNEFWYSLNDGTKSRVAIFRNIKKLYIESVSFEFCPYLAEYAYNVDNAEFVHCRCLGTANNGGFRSFNANVQYNNCEAYRCGSDGFATGGEGTVNLINCTGAYNRDDGVSHHANANGYIEGGAYHHNGKAGIASPVQGSRVDMSNIFSYDNTKYGIHIAKDSDDGKLTPCRISNAACWDNGQYDLHIGYGWDVLAKSCLWTTTDVSANSDLTELS